MHYAAFLEGLSINQQHELTTILFDKLYLLLNVDQKSEYTCPKQKNFKILKQGKTYFYYNSTSQLLESAYPEHCKKTLITAAKQLGFPEECVSFFQKLQFGSSEADALMLSANGLLFSKTPRIHKMNNQKVDLFYEGVVSAEFGINQLLVKNAGLVLGHLHLDFSSYVELCDLLPKIQTNFKNIYFELPYSHFFPLFDSFNRNKKPNVEQILIKLSENKLYNNDEKKELNDNFRKLFLAAKYSNITIYPCDVGSPNFFNLKERKVNKDLRLKVGNACMIRSIEKFQFNQKHPKKFMLLVGLAHAQTIAHELGVPCCFIGDRQQLANYQHFTQHFDYFCFSNSKTFYSFDSSYFWRSASNTLNQNHDPKIKQIIDHWDQLTQKMPKTFSLIPVKEIKNAREAYIEYILEHAAMSQNNISDICTTLEQFFIKQLQKAIYPKSTELLHPKNWCTLFQCQRPYGIRLAEKESEAFSVTHLNALTIKQLKIS